MPLDPTSFTSTRMLCSLASSSPSARLTRADPGARREFLAIAVTDASPLSYWAHRGFVGRKKASGTGVSRLRYASDPFEIPHTDGFTTRFQVICKIVGDATQTTTIAQHNPHNYLPSCGDGTDDPHSAVNFIRCLTTEYTEEDPLITEGDALIIGCEFDRYGKINLERGTVISVVKNNHTGLLGSLIAGRVISRTTTCAEETASSLEELFY